MVSAQIDSFRKVITREEFFYVLEDNYDEHIELAIPFYKIMHAEVIRCTPQTKEPLRILDLGSGTGKTACVFLENFPESTVRAFDLFEEMQRHARNRLLQFGDRVQYVTGDFMEIPLGEDFDVCVSSLAIHHQLGKGKRELFRRIFRCLKPGGRFLLIDWTRFTSHFMQSAAASVAEHHALEKIPSASIVRSWCEHWRTKNIPETVEDLCIWLREAGFSSAECVIRYYGIALICAERNI